MRDRKTALLWAVAWYFGRRWLRRRAALALAGVAAGASARRSRIRNVVAALALVGALAGALVVWRRLAGGPQEELVSADGPVPQAEAPVAAPAP